jgi:hypothetical protein
MSRNRNLSKALKSDFSDLIPALAKAVQKHGRKNDTVLAHISPAEARLLKARGGSGTINPHTGLPEYDNPTMGDYGSFDIPAVSVYDSPSTPYETISTDVVRQPAVTTTQTNPNDVFAGSRYDTGTAPQYMNYAFAANPNAQFQLPDPNSFNVVPPAGQQQVTTAPPSAPPTPLTGADVQAQAQASDVGNLGSVPQQAKAAEPGFLDTAKAQFLKGISDPATLAKIGLGVGTGALGFGMQQRSIAQAKNAAAQIKQAQQTAAAQERALAQPIANQAASVMGQTVQGQLTPASLQAFQAMQAQEAQRMASAGGVGAQQMEANHARAITALLDGQQKTYLSLFSASNPMMQDAINKDLAGTTQGLTTSLDLQAKANQASAQLYGSIMTALASSMKSGS